MSSSSASEAPTEALSFSLLHLTGARRGQEERFSSDRVAVGRGRNNDCSFDPERERSVSHRHCEIRIEDSVPILYDIGSLNGTYLNGRRVRRSPMADGDEIGLGREGPRLKFIVHSGITPRPMSPLSPAALGPNKTAGTAQEASLSGMVPTVQALALRRYRMGAVALGLALIVLSVAALMVISRMQGRIDVLESESGEKAAAGPSHGDPREAAERPPGPGRPGAVEPVPGDARPPLVPSGSDGTTVLVLGQVRVSGEPVRIQRELGGGVLVRGDRVATTLTVLSHARAFLRDHDGGRGERSIVVAQAGVLAAAVRVSGFISRTRGAPRDPSQDLALLALAPTPGRTLPRALLGLPRREPARILSPGLSSLEVAISRHTDAEGNQVDPKKATLLRIFSLPNTPSLPLPAMSGFPIFSGGVLAGLYLGDRYPNIAVSSTVISRLVDFADGVPPQPLK